MDNLRHYYVDQNLSQISPYKEPAFNERSSKLNITMPFDPIQGSVYLLQQLLHKAPETQPLEHHFAILKLLESHSGQNHSMLLIKPLAQYCVSSLYKLGQIDLTPKQIEEIIANDLTSEVRLFLLKILTKIAQFSQFLENGFGWKNQEFTWLSTPEFEFQKAEKSDTMNLVYVEKTIQSELQQQYDIEQLLDQQILNYINSNTQNILNITSASSEFLFSAESFIEIIIASAGDKNQSVANQALKLIISLYLSNETQFLNLIFTSNAHVHLTDLLAQRIKFPTSKSIDYDTQLHSQFFNDFSFILSSFLELQGAISSLSQTKIFNSLITLSMSPQTCYHASIAILTAVETEISVISIISKIDVDFPLHLIKAITNQFQNQADDAMKLVSFLLENTQIAARFSDHFEEFLAVVGKESFACQSILEVINKASKIPCCQIKVRNWLASDDSLVARSVKNAFQPDTSDILIKQDYLRCDGDLNQ